MRTLIIATALIFGGVLFILGIAAFTRLREAWDNGYPTALHASRNPPWQNPRRLSSPGTKNEMADCRLLRKRLTTFPGPVSDEILRELARRAPLNPYYEPIRYVDRETGQHWIEVEYEAGFNQWTELVPAVAPDTPQATLNNQPPDRR